MHRSLVGWEPVRQDAQGQAVAPQTPPHGAAVFPLEDIRRYFRPVSGGGAPRTPPRPAFSNCWVAAQLTPPGYFGGIVKHWQYQ